jgi:hypothetical protein
MKKEILKLIEGEVEKVVSEAYDEWDIEAERRPTKRDQEVYKRNAEKLKKFKQIRKEQIAELKLIGDGWQKDFNPDSISTFNTVLYNPLLSLDDIKKGPADTTDIDKQLDNIDEEDYEWDDDYRNWVDQLPKIKKARQALVRLVDSSKRFLQDAKDYQESFLPGGEDYEYYTNPKKIFKLKPDQIARLWNEITFHVKDAYEEDRVRVTYQGQDRETRGPIDRRIYQINIKFLDALVEGIKEQRELAKLSIGGGEVVEEGKLSSNDMAEISNNVFETLFLQLQNSRKGQRKDYLAGLEVKYDTKKIMSVDKDMGSLAINEGVFSAPLFLLEEMTKDEMKKLVKTELEKNLKRMVKDELEKVLKDDKKVKNQIGDLSKEILKMLYKDLSIHHGYVIDRVKF